MPTANEKTLRAQLEKIKDKGSKEARAIRKQLRKMGAGIRKGKKDEVKKEEKAPVKKAAKKVEVEEEDEDTEE
jgi:hypothetical protein